MSNGRWIKALLAHKEEMKKKMKVEIKEEENVRAEGQIIEMTKNKKKMKKMKQKRNDEKGENKEYLLVQKM